MNIDSIQELVEQTATRLRLRWLTPQPSRARPLRGLTSQHRAHSLIGPLNCIHPNRLQVIGPSEIAYLNALGRSAYAEMMTNLFAQQPAAVILANDLELHPPFRSLAVRTHTPLLSTPLDDQTLINHLQHILTRALAERVTLHGVFIEVLGTGVLLCGDAGIGKSELALELITRGHRLIADDAPCFARITPEAIEGTCPRTLRDFLEVRGLGILNIRAMFGEDALVRSKPLDLVIDLQPIESYRHAYPDRLGGSLSTQQILEVAIPRIVMPVAPGRNLAILVEVAVRHQMLRMGGYDATTDFTARQARLLDPQPPAAHHND